jgi:hypothetical protein
MNAAWTSWSGIAQPIALMQAGASAMRFPFVPEGVVAGSRGEANFAIFGRFLNARAKGKRPPVLLIGQGQQRASKDAPMRYLPVLIAPAGRTGARPKT